MGNWSTTTGQLNVGHGEAGIVLLQNGKALIIGGFLNPTTCELYDPVAGTWATTGSLSFNHDEPGCVTLQNGKVLCIDGEASAGHCELYDPNTGLWTPTGSLATGRRNFGTWLLTNGKVLVAGGTDQTESTCFSSCEIYDPTLGTWSSAASLPSVLAQFPFCLLGDGRPFVVGGANAPGIGTPPYQLQTYTYDVGGNIWTTQATYPSATGVLNEFGNAAITSVSGDAIIIGGVDSSGHETNLVHKYIHGSDSWVSLASLPTATATSLLYLLDNGHILAVGGEIAVTGGGVGAGGGTPVATTFEYDPVADMWSSGGALSEAANLFNRAQPGGVVLSNGESLWAGQDQSPTTRSQVYTAPPLTLSLSDSITLSDTMVDSFGVPLSDSISISDAAPQAFSAQTDITLPVPPIPVVEVLTNSLIPAEVKAYYIIQE